MLLGKISLAAIRLLFALVALSVLAACGSNVRKGNKDYPQVNPSSSKQFFFNGTIDERLHLRFIQKFSAADSSCSYSKWPVAVNYSVDREIVVHRKGRQFYAVVALDYFLPGRCRYGLGGIRIEGTDQRGRQFSSDNRGFIISMNPMPRPLGASPNSVLSVQCELDPDHYIDAKGKEAPVPEPATNCNTRDVIAWWYPQTRNITVNFYFNGKSREDSNSKAGKGDGVRWPGFDGHL